MYQVIMQDELNNLYHLGFYKSLDDSIDDINEFLSIYDVKLEKGMLKEYSNTFNTAFDVNLGTLLNSEDDNLNCVYIRGLILDKELFKEVETCTQNQFPKNGHKLT